MAESLEDFDFRKVEYPSDRLTLGTVRRAHFDLFDKHVLVNGAVAQPRYFLDGNSFGHALDELGGIQYVERIIAVAAILEAIGEPPLETHIATQELKEELVGRYVRLGIAPGKAAAQELIRKLECQCRSLGAERPR